MPRRLPALLLLALVPVAARAQPTDGAPVPDDPFRWLEEVEGGYAMAWVEAHNAAALAELRADPSFDETHRRALDVYTSAERIPAPALRGAFVFNTWQDAEHPRGLWRRMLTMAYLAGGDDWDVLLDLDALSDAEGAEWAWGGADCLAPAYARCLVSLSRGGSDAAEVREFDVEARAFVPGGFTIPAAKTSATWRDAETLYVGTDTGAGSMTASGYPRTVRVWTRGTPLADAPLLFEAEAGDLGVFASVVRSGGRDYPTIARYTDFFHTDYYALEPDAAAPAGERLVHIELPSDAQPTIVAGQLVVLLKSEWAVGGATYPQGALVSVDYAAFLGGSRSFETVLAPDARSTIDGISTTADRLLVNTLTDVRSALWAYRREGGRWVAARVATPPDATIALGSTDGDGDGYFFYATGFLQPSTLLFARGDATPAAVRQLPAFFDAAPYFVEQFEATSPDSTRVPYFVVRRRDAPMDGSTPTLLTGYGGFEVSNTPGYLSVDGPTWLERGGAYAVANIRGGGEFGPAWHRAALREHRQRAFDDFIAVAEDLIARGLTSPAHLGIEGSSNGGLLVGAALTQRPDLFGAAVVSVPLLDMRRYHELLAGASWMAEYGDPDAPADWAFIRRYSPYHNVRRDARYPRPLFVTTTRDDRVHPGHARKMAALMESMGHPVLFFENTEGGHGSGVTPQQRALMQAVVTTYLLRQLAGEGI